MKNLFALNAKTLECNADKFTLRKLSSESDTKLTDTVNEIRNMDKYARGPLWLSIIMLLTFFFGITVIVAFIEAITEIEIEQALYNARILLPVGGVCLVISAAIFIFKRIRFKNTTSSPLYQSLISECEKIALKCYDELLVPETAETINVFTTEYKINGKGIQKNAAATQFTVYDFKIFVENDLLCLSDTCRVTAIPLSSITDLRSIDKKATFLNWNKPEKINSPKYKHYKVRSFNYGFYVKPYYSLRFTSCGEEYEIIIPPYEIETVSKIINKPVLH